MSQQILYVEKDGKQETIDQVIDYFLYGFTVSELLGLKELVVKEEITESTITTITNIQQMVKAIKYYIFDEYEGELVNFVHVMFPDDLDIPDEDWDETIITELSEKITTLIEKKL